MPELGVNIDHVATVRQARKTYEPDPVWAAALAELGGADGITIHLREDRRHIQDRDLRVLRETVTVKLNLELACVDEIVQIACEVLPEQATLVPERREEITTEGGLDVLGNLDAVRRATDRLSEAGIAVSLFLDPNPRQIEAAADLGARAVELHTGKYASARGAELQRQLEQLVDAGRRVRQLGWHAARRAWLELSQRRPRRADRRHA
jgi:pyridoxine 5-phosphate synthase